MRAYLLIAVLVAATLAGGCETLRDRQMNSRLERQRADALAKIDQPACRAKGGHIRGVGIFGTPACVVPFSDAGKTCSDKSDCSGRCLIYNSSLPEGSPSAGQCQRDDHMDGCWSEIVEGKITGGWCID